MLEFVLELGDERCIGLAGRVGFPQLGQRRHQGFGNEDATIGAEMPTWIGELVRRVSHLHLELRL